MTDQDRSTGGDRAQDPGDTLLLLGLGVIAVPGLVGFAIGGWLTFGNCLLTSCSAVEANAWAIGLFVGTVLGVVADIVLFRRRRSLRSQAFRLRRPAVIGAVAFVPYLLFLIFGIISMAMSLAA